MKRVKLNLTKKEFLEKVWQVDEEFTEDIYIKDLVKPLYELVQKLYSLCSDNEQFEDLCQEHGIDVYQLGDAANALWLLSAKSYEEEV